ncbi:hypothetical protein Sjap_020112 [Stephania japonica]|uniref:Uncharacterized protein n=1 Tax=Stephania japonica TaxID=461633 RepID=A0AAP0F5D2_9MAGN
MAVEDAMIGGCSWHITRALPVSEHLSSWRSSNGVCGVDSSIFLMSRQPYHVLFAASGLAVVENDQGWALMAHQSPSIPGVSLIHSGAKGKLLSLVICFEDSGAILSLDSM